MSLVFQPIVSSNIHSAALDGDAIIVRFRNHTAYRHPGAVSQWKNFEKTFGGKNGLSAGKFYNAQLRPTAYERIEDWEEEA